APKHGIRDFHVTGVQTCALPIYRNDVHFHCWNLSIKDSEIGVKGITITGGGDLFVENTSSHSMTFINFRRDYGAKWDGNISIKEIGRASRRVRVWRRELSQQL